MYMHTKYSNALRTLPTLIDSGPDSGPGQSLVPGDGVFSERVKVSRRLGR
jgi:hypothetical protein